MMEKHLLIPRYSIADIIALTVSVMIGQSGYPFLGFLMLVAGLFISTCAHDAWMHSREG